ncbi:hypothetical protein EW146_g8749 [Bondarzewia mesenterica]|uniref:6-phosphofructo-2-kinase domain-containing protein n=1 Tax=Bondarzewia mesenterica TaxID=1095465 RepID=A0A4S4LBV3_9AGAM|nr:hypothetical protein EW146_g8749 [Bondarzewia mesenterica]
MENQASLSSSFVCNGPVIIAANVVLKVSSGDPDYNDMSLEDAKWDFLRRTKQYEAVYETIAKPRLSYLRITNVGSQSITRPQQSQFSVVADSSTIATSGDPVDNASSLGYTTSPTAQLMLSPAAYARAHSLRIGGCVGLPLRPNQWTKGALAEDSAFERLRPAPLMK